MEQGRNRRTDRGHRQKDTKRQPHISHIRVGERTSRGQRDRTKRQANRQTDEMRQRETEKKHLHIQSSRRVNKTSEDKETGEHL